MAQNAYITGCSGPELSAAERDFFRAEAPWGLILFARNCVDREQIRALVADFRDVVGRPDAPVLIDQEGGRVQRIRAPICMDYPPAALIGRLHGVDPIAGERAAWLSGRLIGEDLHGLGISVDCVPVLDIRVAGAHRIIGDRAFGTDPGLIATLAKAMTDGLSAAGLAPVMKHVPGHGRATADSHDALPLVETPRQELEETDFEPFRRLSTLPMAMTAHVVYSSIDPDAPATLSPLVIDAIIRQSIGFDGLLMSDDLSMGALSGSLEDRTASAFEAGCDMALHCNGDLAEMKSVASRTPLLAGRAAARARTAVIWAKRREIDTAAAREEFLALMEAAGAAGEA